MAENFAARLMQTKLVTKVGISDFVKRQILIVNLKS